jgi:hypothetical protein
LKEFHEVTCLATEQIVWLSSLLFYSVSGNANSMGNLLFNKLVFFIIIIIALLPFFHGCRKRRLNDDGLPPLASIAHSLVILIKRGRLGGISEISLLPLCGQNVSGNYVCLLYIFLFFSWVMYHKLGNIIRSCVVKTLVTFLCATKTKSIFHRFPYSWIS